MMKASLLKTLLAMTLALTLMLAAAPLTLAEADDEPLSVSVQPAAQTRTLSVKGTASVTLKPDNASLSIGVVTTARTVADAQAQNAAAMNKVIDAAKAAGILERDISTTSFHISAQYDYSYSQMTEEQELIGYRVENMLSVTVRDIAAVGSVLDALMTAGANQSYGVSFDSTQKGEAYDLALTDAIGEARRKAKLAADALGETLGETISLSEEATYAYAEAALNRNYAMDGASTQILAGALTVTATVTLRCALR